MSGLSPATAGLAGLSATAAGGALLAAEHGGKGRLAQRRALLDPYASGVFFDGWRDPHTDLRRRLVAPPEPYDPLPALCPTTWLLATGWRRHGLIEPRDTPG